MGVEAELSVDDDAVDIDVIGGGHGEDLVGLDDLVVLGEVEEAVGDAPCQGGGGGSPWETVSWPTASRSGISSRQKFHQPAQKLTMTAFSPRNWSRLTTSPSELVSMKLGAVSPTAVPTPPVLVLSATPSMTMELSLLMTAGSEAKGLLREITIAATAARPMAKIILFWSRKRALMSHKSLHQR